MRINYHQQWDLQPQGNIRPTTVCQRSHKYLLAKDTNRKQKALFSFPSHLRYQLSLLHQELWSIGTSFNTCMLRPRSSSCHKLSYAIDHYLLNEFFHSRLPTIKKKKKNIFFSHFFSFFLTSLSFKFGSVSNTQSVHSFT